MFGGRLEDPGKQPKTPKPFTKDIAMPGLYQNFGHLGREANTNYHVKFLHFKQREGEFDGKVDEKEAALKRRELYSDKFIRHTDNKFLRGEVKRRLDKKLEEHEELINVKREKLSKLLADEEHQYVWETIDQAQRGGEQRISEMKLRSQQLQARNEAKRMEIVKEKKLQQYLERSLEVRPAMEKKNVEEAKKCQLQQMRENEAKREAERELEHFWHDVMVSEVRAKMEREEQEAIERQMRQKDAIDVLEKQIAGKRLLELEQRRVAEEDRLELLKIQEEMRKEEMNNKIGIQNKKQQLSEDLRQQLESERKILEQRKKEEQALENAYNQLSLLEIDREKSKITDASAIIRNEIMQYRSHLMELEKERKLEEDKLHEMLDEYKRAVDAKEDDKKCKERLAKMKLHKEVIEGRARQIEEKKQEARELLKKKQEDNELLNQAIEVNKRLEAEQERQKILAKEKYKQDLQKQIEYGEELRKREREELERQLLLGKQEEEHYQALIKELCQKKIEVGNKHAFRRVLERYDCHCPTTTLKPKY